MTETLGSLINSWPPDLRANWPGFSLRHAPDLPERETRRRVKIIVELLKPEIQTLILDYGTGRGGYAGELVRLGYKDVAAQYNNADRCARAKEAFAEEQGLMVAPGTIETVRYGRPRKVILVDVFGAANQHRKNREMLQKLVDLLEPGGELLIDLINAQTVHDFLKPDFYQLPSGVTVSITRQTARKNPLRLTEKMVFKGFDREIILGAVEYVYRSQEIPAIFPQLKVGESCPDFFEQGQKEKSRRLLLRLQKK